MFSKKESASTTNVSFNNYDTLIGTNTQIEGNIMTKGTLRVDGKVNGNLNIEGDIILGEAAEIIGELKAQSIVVAGKIQGNVYASASLHLTPTAYIEGDITMSNLVIDEGAIFKGSSNMTKQTKDDVIKEDSIVTKSEMNNEEKPLTYSKNNRKNKG